MFGPSHPCMSRNGRGMDSGLAKGSLPSLLAPPLCCGLCQLPCPCLGKISRQRTLFPQEQSQVIARCWQCQGSTPLPHMFSCAWPNISLADEVEHPQNKRMLCLPHDLELLFHLLFRALDAKL